MSAPKTAVEPQARGMIKEPRVPGVPSVPSHTDYPALKPWMRKVVAANKLKQQRDESAAKYEKLKSEIGVQLTLLGLKSCRFGSLRVTVAEGTSASRLNAQKLLEAGVSMETLKECTDPGTDYTSVTIGDAKKEK